MAGYFTDDSMLRRVNRERVLALAGPRALLMQAAHPLAVAGLLAHSSALEEPYERLARTARVLNAIGFRTRAEADRLNAHVRAMHRRARGRGRTAGRPPGGRCTAASGARCRRRPAATPPARRTAPTTPSSCSGCC